MSFNALKEVEEIERIYKAILTVENNSSSKKVFAWYEVKTDIQEICDILMIEYVEIPGGEIKGVAYYRPKGSKSAVILMD